MAAKCLPPELKMMSDVVAQAIGDEDGGALAVARYLVAVKDRHITPIHTLDQSHLISNV
jgi:hypothetical protein